MIFSVRILVLPHNGTLEALNRKPDKRLVEDAQFVCLHPPDKIES